MTYKQELSDEILLKLIKNGDDTAINLLLNKYKNIAAIIANKICSDKNYVEDFIQEGLIKLNASICKFDDTKSSFKTYANRVLRNAMIDYARKNSYPYEQTSLDNITLVLQNLSDDPYVKIINAENNKLFFDNLKLIIGENRFPFMSLYLEGLSYKEIAEKLNCNTKKVDNNITQSKEKLKNYYKTKADELNK